MTKVKKVPTSGKAVSSDQLFEDLVQTVRKYNKNVDRGLLEKAYKTAKEYHGDQVRKTGEPFINHPLQVALILADIEMDQTSIASAILHDIVEDTDYNLEKMTSEFGNTVARITNGVTKLDKIVFNSREEQQVSNIRKMIIAMSEDVRIILVKLADRLHNMRTLKPLDKDKRFNISMETMEVYAPIAHRLGIYQIKSELEDLCFRHLHEKEYLKLKDMIDERINERKSLVDEVIDLVKKKLKEADISADISGRVKSYYSIYNKITRQGRDFEDIYDVLAIRIIVEDVKNCYAVLGIIHSLWKPVPGRFKDFIANPKFNMYQSLHTTVIGLRGKPLEVQIRTFEMHKVAEYGIAAHYKYKEEGFKLSEFDKRVAWIRQLLDWQKELKDPHEYMESLKLDLFEEEVFVFTPKGRVVNLPRGAIPIDFAYVIHTDIGHNAIGAKINGVMVPIESTLENGDIVEIIASKSQKGPSRDWLNIVKTSRAKNKIRQWFSKEQRQESYNTGREIMLKILRKNSLSFKTVSNDVFEGIASDMNFDRADTLFRSIGSHKLSAHQVFTRIVKKLSQSEEKKELKIEDIHDREETRKTGSGINVKGMEEVLVTMAKCCNPVPGDRIVGYITRGKGISVHRADCTNVNTLMSRENERFIDVCWDRNAPNKFNAEIQIEALDRTKLLRDITNTISEYDINILRAHSLKIDRAGHVKFRFLIEINNKYILKDVINNIKMLDSVYDAFRILPGK
jgi:GTP diphosphokinase / guanosine-3',5'-bis(diphosphate) 3'-diphosphatase